MAVCGSFIDSNVENFVEFALRATDFVYGEVYRYPSPSARNLRDRLNPLELYSDDEFRSRYRFSKQSIVLLLKELRLNRNHDKRGEPLPPVLKLLITLRFYSTGAMQTVVGDLVNVSQPSVSRSIWEATQAICVELFRKCVCLPTSAEAKSVKRRFYNIAGFPGVTGCIDCTHVQIISPGGDNAEVYRNRKGVFWINVQAVTGPELQFFDIVAGWPGSVHDSRIFENSRVMTSYEQGTVSGMLLGDQGYACLPYHMPPLKYPQTAAEKRQDAYLNSSAPLILCSLAVYMYLMTSSSLMNGFLSVPTKCL
ncbi:putative nuclease HARBI1 [Dermacentor albipictus]|uniref:putative nuclease HARBI1 n=1 Tax=Dermacentor albipictus TaxID=60249 RepID=UPI0038FC0072